jgi:hypothetical protein
VAVSGSGEVAVTVAGGGAVAVSGSVEERKGEKEEREKERKRKEKRKEKREKRVEKRKEKRKEKRREEKREEKGKRKRNLGGGAVAGDGGGWCRGGGVGLGGDVSGVGWWRWREMGGGRRWAVSVAGSVEKRRREKIGRWRWRNEEKE